MPVDAQIELTDDIPEEGMLTCRIGTPGATWFYQNDAGGFSSLLDADGTDWLSFHPFGGSDGIYRGIPNLDRCLFFVHEEDDAELDSFYQMQNNMTVFGFGRSSLNKYLEGAPKHFTVGLADDAEFAAASGTIEGAYQPVTVTAASTRATRRFS